MQSEVATFGQRLHALRKYRGLSLQALSEITGISRSNLNRYERDASRPTTEYLKLLCAVLSRILRLSSVRRAAGDFAAERLVSV